MQDPPAIPSTFVEGSELSGADPELLRSYLDAAFEYRGDITILRQDGTEVSGYLYDRRSELAFGESIVRLLEPGSEHPVSIPYPQIAQIRFSGRDTAAGKSWENWVRRYAENKIAGENAGIDSEGNRYVSKPRRLN